MALAPYHELELKEIFSRTNSLSTSRLQLFSFFGTLDLTAIGLAVQLNNALFVLLGALGLVVLMVFDSFLRRQMYALYARGLLLEQQYCPNQSEGVIFRLSEAALARSEVERLKTLLQENPGHKPVTQLLKTCQSSRFGVLLPLLVTMGQLMVGLWLLG
ncbi:MAG: hypothetical protein R2824_01620 [Saprospiraceae bacterium]|nr:hypothetical protein [Lewinella sp.]